MTDNEIIKALEDKTHKAEYPWVDSSYCDVEVSLVKNALDLISRLQAEIERLEKHTEMYHELRAEAIKEFITKHREMMLHFCDDDDQISLKVCEYDVNTKSILEEMVGEE